MPKIELNFTQAKLDSFIESTCANHPIPKDKDRKPLHTPSEWTKKYWIKTMKEDNLLYRRRKAGNLLNVDNDLIT
jgi:hypothetical protein